MTDLSPGDGGGWVAIHHGMMMRLLQRAHEGEDPEMLWLEAYANSVHDEGEDG